MMTPQRQKATTTIATITTAPAKSDVPPSTPIQQEGQDTGGLQGTIAIRAYSLYEERGYRQGCDLQDWLDAEREILSLNLPPGKR